MIVRGESSFAGILELRVADRRRLASGIFVVLLSDSMAGEFDSIEMPTGIRDDVRVCRTDRAIVVQVGEVESGITIDDERSPGIGEVLDLIDAMDVSDADENLWDLDRNGLVDAEDPRILLARFTTCD